MVSSKTTDDDDDIDKSASFHICNASKEKHKAKSTVLLNMHRKSNIKIIALIQNTQLLHKNNSFHLIFKAT